MNAGALGVRRVLEKPVLTRALIAGAAFVILAAPALAGGGPPRSKAEAAPARLAQAARLPACLGPLIVPGAPAAAGPCAPLLANSGTAAQRGDRAGFAGAPIRPAHRLSLRRTILIAAAAAVVTGLAVYFATRSGNQTNPLRCPAGTYPDGAVCVPPPSRPGS